MRTKTTILMIALAGLLATTAAADPDGELRLRAIAETETKVAGPTGETEIVRTEAGRVTPGTEVIYSVFFENSGGTSAEDVVITNPVPEHMVCVAVEPDERAIVTVSVDGGASFGAVGQLVVVDEAGHVRPAELGDCTHVRWNFVEPVAPGSEGFVSFRAILQ